MASSTGISTGQNTTSSTSLQVQAAAISDKERASQQWEAYRSYDAFMAMIRANPGALAIVTTPPRRTPTTIAQANAKSVILTAQHSYSKAAKAQSRSDKIAYRQRKKDLAAKISVIDASISTLNTQLCMLRTEHSLENVSFDILDAQDLALELEGRRELSEPAANARAARAAKRDANAALVAAANAQIATLVSAITDATQAHDKAIRRQILAAAKTSLRGLRALKAVPGAKVPTGEHKGAFWNAVRRALKVKKDASAEEEDVACLEAFKSEIQGPDLSDVLMGLPPAIEVVEEFPHMREERDGMFSISGWQM